MESKISSISLRLPLASRILTPILANAEEY
jgi:hypothetical protein